MFSVLLGLCPRSTYDSNVVRSVTANEVRIINQFVTVLCNGLYEIDGITWNSMECHVYGNLKSYPEQWKPRRTTEIRTGDRASWATAVATRPGPDQRFSMASWFSCYGWVCTGYGSRVWIYRYGGMDFNKKTQLPSFGGMDLGYGFIRSLYGFQKNISEIYVNQLRADSFAHSRITCKTNPAIYIYIYL